MGLLALVVATTSSACFRWNSEEPAAPTGPTVLRATQIAAEWESTCAVSVEGDVYCWGSECHGAPVDGLFNLVCSWPKKVAGLSKIKSIALGMILDPDCALDRDGAVWCGRPHEGFARVDVPAATAIANASSFACALRADRTVSCWAGTGPRPPGKIPSIAIPELHNITAISARSGHALAVDERGAAYSFVLTTPGGKQQPATQVAIDPVRSVSLAEYYPYLDVQFSARRIGVDARAEGGHTCAVLAAGDVRCWGGGDTRGELGTGRACDKEGCSTAFGDVVNVRLPNASPVTSVVTGLAHSCALHTDGTAYCWGNNATGELGGKSKGWFSGKPVEVETRARFVQLAAANNHTCGLTGAGEIFCWGTNEDGQLGRASREPKWSSVPEAVAF